MTSIPEKTVRVDSIVGASSGVDVAAAVSSGVEGSPGDGGGGLAVTAFSSSETAAGVEGIIGVLAVTDLSSPGSGRADANGRTRQSARTRKTGKERLNETAPGGRKLPALLLFCCRRDGTPPPVRILLA
jgi:hypothetical protein